MPRIIIHLDRDGPQVYAEQEADVTLIDVADLRQEYEDDPNHLKKELEKVEKELLHKTTGLRQVYP